MKEGNLNKEWIVLEGEFASRLIHDEPTIELLALLMRESLNLTQMAERLNLGKSTVYYQLQKLLTNNIVSCIREEKRQGRALKYYAANSERFYIPFAYSSSSDLYEFFAQKEYPKNELFLRSSLRTQANYSSNWGLAIFKAEKGVATGVLPDMTDSLDSYVENANKMQTPALWSSWSSLLLDSEQAKRLQIELTSLFERYNMESQIESESDPKVSRYLMRLGITPTKD